MLEPIPQGLNKHLYGQYPDFAVQARKLYPAPIGFLIMMFGCFWLIITSPVLKNIFQGELVNSIEKLQLSPAITFDLLINSGLLLLLFPLLFIIMGLGFIVRGYRIIKAPGPFVVGTKEGLHTYKEKKDLHTFIPRTEFSGKISQFLKAPNQLLILELTSKRNLRANNGAINAVNNYITISSIDSFNQVKEMITKRIEQGNNDTNNDTDTLSF